MKKSLLLSTLALGVFVAGVSSAKVTDRYLAEVKKKANVSYTGSGDREVGSVKGKWTGKSNLTPAVKSNVNVPSTGIVQSVRDQAEANQLGSQHRVPVKKEEREVNKGVYSGNYSGGPALGTKKEQLARLRGEK